MTGPKVQYTLSGLLLSLMVALILEGAFSLSLLLAWLAAINLIAALFYAIDKLNSKSPAGNPARIPEISLLALALVGGSPAAALTMLILTHKTSKASFLLNFALVVAIQGVALYLLRDAIPWPVTSILPVNSP